MTEIVNMFLLAGNKFMSEMYLKQPGFTYSAHGWCPAGSVLPHLRTPSFPTGLVKTKSDFIVRPVETDLGR